MLGESIVTQLLGSKIAVVPGGYKPPTTGHFYLVKEAANHPGVEKVIVLIGHKERDGITKEQSLAIWEVYKKYLPSSVTVCISKEKAPILDMFHMLQENKGRNYLALIGIRNKEDEKDLSRFKTLKAKFGNQLQVMSVDGLEEINATTARQTLLNKDVTGFQRFLPSELSRRDRDKVWEVLQGKHQVPQSVTEAVIVSNPQPTTTTPQTQEKPEDQKVAGKKPNATIYELTVNQLIDQFEPIKVACSRALTDAENLEEFKSRNYAAFLESLPNAKQELKKLPPVEIVNGTVVRGMDRIEAIYLLQNLSANREKEGWTKFKLKCEIKGDVPNQQPEETNQEEPKLSETGESLDSTGVEKVLEGLKPLIKEYTAFVGKSNRISPLPKVKFIDSKENAENALGKTGLYDPETKTISLFITGRHPKDILRTYAHELIHHLQNLQGRLHNIKTTDINEDENLKKLEEEAYLQSQILLRSWENGKSKEGDVLSESAVEDLETLTEGVYDTITRSVVTTTLRNWKKQLKEDKKIGRYKYTEEFDVDDAKGRPMQFTLNARLVLTKNNKKEAEVTGNIQPELFPPVINITVKLGIEQVESLWSDVYMNLVDVVRHEIEHLTQTSSFVRGGYYEKPGEEGKFEYKGKQFDAEYDERDKIRKGELPASNYFKLPQEVDAILQGIYLKAKKSKQPFLSLLKSELGRYTSEKVESGKITRLEADEILSLWKQRAKHLGLKGLN